MLARMCLIGGLVFAAPSAFASDLDGVWTRGDGKARVRIASCGAQTCATNVWVADPAGGEAVGDVLVMTLTRKGEGAYAGQGYDRKRKLTVSLNIKVAAKSFTSSGCVLGGIICRNVTWSR